MLGSLDKFNKNKLDNYDYDYDNPPTTMSILEFLIFCNKSPQSTGKNNKIIHDINSQLENKNKLFLKNRFIEQDEDTQEEIYISNEKINELYFSLIFHSSNLFTEQNFVKDIESNKQLYFDILNKINI
tara:strand:+ start:149 stop:532 length:384 start_codon:yes stop_codon:yes gene_type:complete